MCGRYINSCIHDWAPEMLEKEMSALPWFSQEAIRLQQTPKPPPAFPLAKISDGKSKFKSSNSSWIKLESRILAYTQTLHWGFYLPTGPDLKLWVRKKKRKKEEKVRSASGLPSETSWVAWSSLHFLLSCQGGLAFGISKGLETKIISLPAHFSISSELYIWGPRRVCPHFRYWILCSPYVSLTCFISSPFFFFLSSSLFFFFSPPFERGCQALLEHKDRNESNLSTEANLSGIFKWDKWRRLEQQFPDMLECQEPRRAVTQKDDFSAAIPLSCCPATPQYRLMNVYLLQEVKRQAIHTAWGQNRLRHRCSLQMS